MTTKEIWMIENKNARFRAFLERYMELDQFTRTLTEKDEMAEIGDAILPTLIKAFCADDKDWLCLDHAVGALAQGVECIACFERDSKAVELLEETKCESLTYPTG